MYFKISERKVMTMKKSFIVVGSIVNILAAIAFVATGCGMKEPHRLEDGVYLAVPTILTITLGWLIVLVFGRKMPHKLTDAVSILYVCAIGVFAITVGALVSWDGVLIVGATLSALGVLGIAYVLIFFTVYIIERRRR